MPCCRQNSVVATPASPCFRMAMICSSLCWVPFIAVLLSWVWENSHCRWLSFRGLGQVHTEPPIVLRFLHQSRFHRILPDVFTFLSQTLIRPQHMIERLFLPNWTRVVEKLVDA